ncbi:MAG: alanine--glyoxylate aminotransferase family protein [Candidatus Rokubacteria bacterium]|nr:alanine--glyoxylate aminotransferase family protein [Candidatus Rokubacteria bacterium]
MKKYYLFAPGPTPIPPEVLQALSRPILHHRTPEFEALFARVRTALADLFETRSEVLILAASGTGAMEAAVVNLLSPGDEAIVIRCGKFGERWGEICAAFGVQVHALDAPYGETVPPDRVVAALNAHPGAKALFATQSETSTGVLQDIEAYAALSRRTETLLVVDTVSSFGALPCPMDAWGVDVVVAGSQKGLMCPPGLGFITLSDRAWHAAESARLPKFYWDLRTERRWQAKRQAQFTPAVSLLMGLDVAIGLLKTEGLPQVYRRHDRLARAMRAGVEALGLTLFPRATASPAVTAVTAPPGVDGEAVVRAYGEEHNITIAGGQGEMKGRIFRLAHLGYVGEYDVLVGLAALERVLAGLGVPVEFGAGLAAAQRLLAKDS